MYIFYYVRIPLYSIAVPPTF